MAVSCPCVPLLYVVPLQCKYDPLTLFLFPEETCGVTPFPCLGCCSSNVSHLKPFAMITPCLRNYTVHVAHFVICEKQACIDYLNKCIAKFANDRCARVELLGRVDVTDQLLKPVIQRLYDGFEQDASRPCAECGVLAYRYNNAERWTTKTCGRCRRVNYCNAVCQSKHWTSTHKALCAPVERVARGEVTDEMAHEWGAQFELERTAPNDAVIRSIYRNVVHNLCGNSSCRKKLTEGDTEFDAAINWLASTALEKTATKIRFCKLSCLAEAMRPVSDAGFVKFA